MIKRFLPLLLIFSYSFIYAEEKVLELVSTNPKIEDLKIVKVYPYDEGQNISKVPPPPSKKPLVYTENELKYIEELRQISMEEFDKADDEKEKETQQKKPEEKEVNEESPLLKIQKVEQKIYKVVEKSQIKQINTNPFSDILQYEQIIIEVDSSTNVMTIKAKIDNQIKVIKTFKVSTGKIGIEKPFGDGRITKISLNPVWYPTQDTIKTFRKKGIFLPPVVEAADKYNYMGAAKINLTHEVNGKSTFRIHGTLNEKTIGTNESAGCIRMKNNEVVQLATLVNDFSHIKSLNEVTVVLK
jgi:L,D-transpeptidase YcfS